MRLLAFLLTMAHLAAAASSEKKLNLFIWAGSVPKEVVDQFEQETGIEVIFNQYDSDESAEAKLLTGETGYDVMSPTLSPFFLREASLGLFLELDEKKLPNLKHLDPHLVAFLKKEKVPLQFGLPYFWGTVGYGYNREWAQKVLPDAPLDSLDLLYNPEILAQLEGCPVYLLESPIDVLSSLFAYLKDKGIIETMEITKENLHIAKEHLKKIYPYITHFESLPDKLIQSLVNEEACIVQCWSGECLRARAEAKASGKPYEIIYTVPREGGSLWIDFFAVPKTAPHPENAFLFLNFLLRPDIAAKNALSSQTAVAIQNIAAYIPENKRTDLFKSLDAETFQSLHIIQSNSFRQDKLLTRAWYNARLGL